MTVIQRIQSLTGTDEPVDVVFYTGDSLAQAIAAAGQAAAAAESPDAWFTVLSVTINF